MADTTAPAPHAQQAPAVPTVQVRCYGELNDSLPSARRQRTFGCALPEPPTLLALLGMLGIPAQAVDLALRNGRSVGLAARLRPGDRVAFYPVFEALDLSTVTRLPGRPLRRPRFAVDVHLGGLARLLRMLGFDTLWRQDWSDAELARVAAEEGRVLLTRDRGLLEAHAVPRRFRPTTDRPRAQLAEVVARLQLLGAARPFTRCMVCNAAVTPVPKDEVWADLPQRTRRHHERFLRCTGCGKVYWEGAHHRDMRALLARLAREAALP